MKESTNAYDNIEESKKMKDVSLVSEQVNHPSVSRRDSAAQADFDEASYHESVGKKIKSVAEKSDYGKNRPEKVKKVTKRLMPLMK